MTKHASAAPSETAVPPEVQTILGRLGPIDQDIVFRLIRPDLTISVDRDPFRTTCRQVTFTVVLSPSLLARFARPSVYTVEVVVFDEYVPPETRTVPISSRGGSVTLTVQLPDPPAGVITPGSWSRTYYIIADPRRQIAERNDGNNFATVRGSCIT